MSRNHTLHSVICLAATVVAAGTLAASALAQGRPASMSQEAYAVLMARSDALNKLHHLGAYTATTTSVPAGMSVQQYRALMARSDALNRLYHLGKYAHPAPSPPAVTTGTGFEWSNVAIAVAAALGLAALVGAGAATRAYWHPPAKPSH